MARDSKRPEEPPREQVLPDPAAECAHLAIRPAWETDGYVCDDCDRALTPLEAEAVSSEAATRGLGVI
ncbi:MAG: hypothetical protein WC273_06890 [Dehalococcoidia bacterium]